MWFDGPTVLYLKMGLKFQHLIFGIFEQEIRMDRKPFGDCDHAEDFAYSLWVIRSADFSRANVGHF